MKKIILIDGHNFMFRAFYATSESGVVMKTNSGIHTNAIYGFMNMLSKIIKEENPTYLAVAFDKGKNFRKQEFDFYKDGRRSTPIELNMQFPYIKELLKRSGIKALDFEPYEADDIIGTIVKMCEEDPEFDATIISSDVDLLQLINSETDVKLLKQKGYIRYDLNAFREEYGIEPINIIDLKALMGDSSDNIPGVKGIGQKGALKLLHEYKNLDGIYENIDSIKGSVHDKLVDGKDSAYMSYKIATIYKDVPLDFSLEDLLIQKPSSDLNELYKELEFYSMLKSNEDYDNRVIDFVEVNSVDEIVIDKDVSLYIETDNENYNNANVLGASISTLDNNYFVKKELIGDLFTKLDGVNVSTYDIKKQKKFFDIEYNDDVMVSSFLQNKNVKDDITNIIMDAPGEISFKEIKKKKFDLDVIKRACVCKSRFIFDTNVVNLNLLSNDGQLSIYRDIEIPLSNVLSLMENNGVKCEKDVLIGLQKDILESLEIVQGEIHELAGERFNIASPKQLGDILFDKMALPSGKKTKTGYSTDAKVLEKLRDKHEIVDKILLFRNLSKINSTYIDGIKVYLEDSNIINPIFKQTLARTGRLSCTEPNLQNIPVREELGRQIRKAFVAKNDLLLSADYSQIELRILAHISGDVKLIEAFNSGEDIHKMVAADMYNKDLADVTKTERKTAKAVIFGIVYGISGFGLGESLKISKKDADVFINKYLELYPGVKKYMDDIISSTKVSGVVTTIYNRKRVIDEIQSSNFIVRSTGERMALNTPIQGTSADILKVAMINIDRRFKIENIKSQMILQVHDELIFDCFNDEVKKVSSIVKEEMESVIKLSVPLVVETSSAKTWFEV